MAKIFTVKSSSTRCTIKEPPSSLVGHPALSYSANLLQHVAWASHLFVLVQTNGLWWSDYLSDGDVHKLSCLSMFIFWCCRPSGLLMCHSMASSSGRLHRLDVFVYLSNKLFK